MCELGDIENFVDWTIGEKFYLFDNINYDAWCSKDKKTIQQSLKVIILNPDENSNIKKKL